MDRHPISALGRYGNRSNLQGWEFTPAKPDVGVTTIPDIGIGLTTIPGKVPPDTSTTGAPDISLRLV
jgi:hypothetical protein